MMKLRSSESCILFFFFNDPATTDIYTLSLHDALPISSSSSASRYPNRSTSGKKLCGNNWRANRSEEHTSELQTRFGNPYAVFFLKKINFEGDDFKDNYDNIEPRSFIYSLKAFSYFIKCTNVNALTGYLRYYVLRSLFLYYWRDQKL